MDRFITGGGFFDPLTSPIRYNKSPDQLSPTEKLFRRRDIGANPFSRARDRVTKRPYRWNSARHRVQSPYVNPHSVEEALFEAATFNALPETFGQFSRGTSLSTGRVSIASEFGIFPDEVGEYLANEPTTVRNYMAKFLDDEISTKDDRYMYETRIAFALELDLASRVLSTSQFLKRKEPSFTLTSFRSNHHPPLTWKDNGWEQFGSKLMLGYVSLSCCGLLECVIARAMVI
jgi:hypothetical protein